MGQLALGVVGGVIGFFASGGTPLGAQIGFAIGSGIGSVIFAPDLPTIEGPRAKDLELTTSTLGRPLPIIYGTYRLGGNLIWGLPIREVRTETEEGGKKGGKGGQTVVSYSYFGTGAVAVCEGPATIIKLWADSKKIFDKTGDTIQQQLPDDIGLFNVISAKHGFGDVFVSGTDLLRFYNGSQTQNPDQAIQADKGVNLTPAFRGTCYFVFDQLPLKDYGNRIPQWSILATSNPLTTFPLQTTTTVDNGGAEYAIISPDGYFYLRDYDDTGNIEYVSNTNFTSVNRITMDKTSLGDGVINSSRWHDVNSNGEILGFVLIEDGGFDDYQQVVWDSEGRLLFAGVTTLGTSVNPYQGGAQWIGPPGNEVIYTAFGDILSIPAFITTGIVGGPGTFGDHFGGNGPVREPDHINGPNSTSFLDLNSYLGTGSVIDLRRSNFTTDNEGNVWIGVKLNVSGNFWLVQMEWPTSIPLFNTLMPSNWTIADTANSVGSPISFEPTSNTLFWTGNGAPGGATTGITKGINFYDLNDASFDHLPLDFENSNTYSLFRNYTRFPSNDGTLWIQRNLFSSEGRDSFHVNLIDRELIETVNLTTVWGLPTNAEGHFYDVINHAIIAADDSNRFHWLFLDRGGGGNVTDQTIVDDISTRVDFDVATEINSSALTKIREGYSIGRTMEARKALEQLGTTGFWIGAEIDHQIKYINRGGAIDKAIPEDDLGAHTLGSNPIQKIIEQKIDQFELPMEVAIHYLDKDTDFQTGSQSFKRSTEVISTRRTVNVATALVMLTDDAIQTAQKLVQQTWAERVQLVSKLTWEHIDVTPGSVLQIITDGTTFQVFVATTSYDANGIVTLECVTDRAPAFDSTLSGIDNDIPDNDISRLGPSFFKVLDIPLARDQIDGIGTHIVGAALDGSSTWRGVQINKAPDLVTFSLPYSFVSNSKRVTWGRTTNILGDATPYKFDRTNSVNVNFISGTMVSATETQILNGSNLILLSSSTGNGWEYLNAADITVESDGTLTLSKFLRGRRNTENAMDGHVINDIVIVFTTGTVDIHNEDSSSIGSELKFQGITLGAVTGTTQSISPFTGASFKPYSVYAPFGSITSDDWTFNWTRRTRIGGAWKNVAWNGLPISQTDNTIKYEVDILNGSTVVRTITDTISSGGSVITVSTDSALYTSADQVTDFGSNQTTISIVIYQIDTLVGRGEPNAITLTG